MQSAPPIDSRNTELQVHCRPLDIDDGEDSDYEAAFNYETSVFLRRFYARPFFSILMITQSLIPTGLSRAEHVQFRREHVPDAVHASHQPAQQDLGA